MAENIREFTDVKSAWQGHDRLKTVGNLHGFLNSRSGRIKFKVRYSNDWKAAIDLFKPLVEEQFYEGLKMEFVDDWSMSELKKDNITRTGSKVEIEGTDGEWLEVNFWFEDDLSDFAAVMKVSPVNMSNYFLVTVGQTSEEDEEEER